MTFFFPSKLGLAKNKHMDRWCNPVDKQKFAKIL